MDIVIIGTGNVAETLGTIIYKSGHTILQVYGRTHNKAAQLADKLESKAVSKWQEINPLAQLYVVALSDAAIADVSKYWNTKKGMVVHTAGSVAMDALVGVSKNYGVLYPLQSLRAPYLPQAAIPLLVNANTPDDLTFLTDFAHSISPQVQYCNDENRLRMHLAAVMVNNFTNHLYRLAWDYCQQNGLDFQLLQPLIVETALRVPLHPPAALQTGPALRNDANTMESHLALLKNNPSMAQIYKIMSESILQTAKDHTASF